MVTKERTQWIDSCRFFAIFIIMLTHFLAEFCPRALTLWESGISSWFLYGLTGKFSVAFFFVLLGYFASAAQKDFRLTDFFRYSLKRYVQFAFYIFLCTAGFILGSYAAVSIFHNPGETVFRVISDGFKYNFIYLLRDAFLFEDNYNATLWCMQQIFIASLVCRALAALSDRGWASRLLAALLLMLLLMLIDSEYCVWICAALLGYILRLLLENQKLCAGLRSAPALLMIALAVLVLIKLRMPESVLQYSLQSLAAFLLVLLHFQLPAAQRILSTKPFPWLGSISMGLFVVHTPINSLLQSTVLVLLPGTVGTVICFVFSMGLSIVCAWLLHRCYAMVSGKQKATVTV